MVFIINLAVYELFGLILNSLTVSYISIDFVNFGLPKIKSGFKLLYFNCIKIIKILVNKSSKTSKGCDLIEHDICILLLAQRTCAARLRESLLAA